MISYFGVDFSSTNTQTLQQIKPYNFQLDDIFHSIIGASHHALLEWSAVCIALLTVILAISHCRINNDMTTPIIGIALFCSGMMDAFHTMSALRLIEASAPNSNLIPFTWALARTFNAVILIIGVMLALKLSASNQPIKMINIIIIGTTFTFSAYLLIHLAAISPSLPSTQFPSALFRRPYDILPLCLFILASPLFWLLYKDNPNRITASLFLSLIPATILECHMAFGSKIIFDNHFNIAHFLKIIEYLIPFCGLTLEYKFFPQTTQTLPRTKDNNEIEIKIKDNGTGQGLAMTYSVIKDKLNGSISVDSEVGQGCLFIIRLPIKEQTEKDKKLSA